eukprot:scaffold4182_cov49-Phaeocystis_antarctica.AAC.3
MTKVASRPVFQHSTRRGGGELEKGLPEVELGASLYGPGTVSVHRVVSGVQYGHISSDHEANTQSPLQPLGFLAVVLIIIRGERGYLHLELDGPPQPGQPQPTHAWQLYQVGQHGGRYTTP